jgi:hypothetical protein
MDRFALPVDHVFDSVLDNFATRIQDATKHNGVDIVVSQQQGSHISGAMSILADFGQFIDINGKNSAIHLPPSKSNATIARIDMPHVMEARPAIVSTLFQLAFKKYAIRGILLTPVRPITDLSNLLKEDRTSISVLSLAKATPILVPTPRALDLELD